MGLFNPTTGKRASGQGGQLTIAGVGTFGVTSCKPKRSYNNADVTVTTSNCWEEFVPICRGLMYDIEVPFDANQTAIDVVFDAQFNANPGNPISVTFQITNAARTYQGGGVMENYELDDSAKDAVRLIFSIRVTGPVAIS